MIEGLGPYPEMKESGVPGVGRVPATWDVLRAKHLFREVDEQSATGSEELLSVSHKTGVTPRREKTVSMFMAESNVGYKLCRPEDIAINTMWAWMSALGVVGQAGIVSPAYGVYRPRQVGCFNRRFLDELLRTAAYRGEYVVRSTGITSSRLRLYPDQFLQIPLVAPRIAEQELIVRFLAHTDHRIRRLIAAKQRMIRLLEEERIAVVGRAVTRGLDPKVRLRPSGIPWFGDVPAHWEVARFKRRVSMQEGPGIMAADFRDEGVPLLRISCLRGAVATLKGCNYLDPAKVAQRWAHFAIKAGDYLLTSSASTGAVVLADDVVAGAIPYTGIIRLWPCSDRAYMPFIRLFIASRPFQDQIDAAKSGVGIEHFGPTHLKRMLVCLPPRTEQEAIVRWVDENTGDVGNVLSREHSAVALLREYRTRLIADLVTGKLDVRAAAAALPDEDEPIEPLDDEEVEDDDTPDAVPDEPEP